MVVDRTRRAEHEHTLVWAPGGLLGVNVVGVVRVLGGIGTAVGRLVGRGGWTNGSTGELPTTPMAASELG